MAKETIGQANHVHDDGDISTISINIIRDEPCLIGGDFITLKESNESIIINSREQWKQVNAFVLKAFNELDI